MIEFWYFLGIWDLKFGAYLLFGAWDLEFHPFGFQKWYQFTDSYSTEQERERRFL